MYLLLAGSVFKFLIRHNATESIRIIELKNRVLLDTPIIFSVIEASTFLVNAIAISQKNRIPLV